MFKVNELIW